MKLTWESNYFLNKMQVWQDMADKGCVRHEWEFRSQNTRQL